MRANVLLSYWFWKKADLARVLDGFPERPLMFADSGGFSAASCGAIVDVDEYAVWLDANRAHVDIACTLDVIGDADATWANTRRLEDHGHRVLPVFHTGEPWEWLERYCESYRYVGVGGMVPYSMQPAKVMRWLIRCFEIADRHGTVIHGLGQTNLLTIAALPFYSVDSSSWVAAERFGTFTLWDDQRARLITFRRAADPRRTRELGALFRAHGLDPAAITDPMYGRPTDAKPKGCPQIKAEQQAARAASLRAWLALNDWLARRHGPVKVDGLPDGPRVFVVCLDGRQVATVRDVMIDSASTA